MKSEKHHPFRDRSTRLSSQTRYISSAIRVNLRETSLCGSARFGFLWTPESLTEVLGGFLVENDHGRRYTMHELHTVTAAYKGGSNEGDCRLVSVGSGTQTS